MESLNDVAEWLGFIGETKYNDWCTTATPAEFRERLLAAK